jgi:diguanylate cyclase (GGDEF)-like protein/PAS domain S-box-containing protein
MNWKLIQGRSLKTRVTLFTLAIFVASIWSLSFYLGRMLRDDMQRQLGEQQFATVSLMAETIDEHLDDRVKALEQVASKITPTLLADTQALQSYLNERPVFNNLFSGGVFISRPDGVAIAEAPLETGRIGLNFMDRDAVAVALTEGKSFIGRPVMGKQPAVPVFGIATPIRDSDNKVIGALAGVVALQRAGFLDHLTQSKHGKTGGYFLVALEERLIITATQKARIMQPLHPRGAVPAIDRFIDGYEGTQLYINPFGVEVLSSGLRLTAVGWGVSASMPTKEAFAPVRDLQRRMLIATIFLTLLAGALTWWMLRHELAPVLETAKMLAHLTASDQPAQPLAIARQDEIGELIGGFNRLLGTLAQREVALRTSEQKLFSILESVDACIYLKNMEGRYLFANRPVCELFGKPVHEIVGQSDACFFDAGTAAKLRTNDALVLQQGQTLRIEETNVHAGTGRTTTYFSVKLPLRNEAGEIYALCGISTDITERKSVEEAVAKSEAKYHMLFDSTSDAVMMMDERGFFGCNPAALAMYGCATEEEFCSYHPVELSPLLQPCGTDSRTLASQHIATAMAQGHDHFEWTHTRADTGEAFVAEILLNAMTIDDKTVLQATARNITERKMLEEQIRQLAFYDPLTGLPNRRLLNDRLEQTIEASKRSGMHAALMFLDLDNFKPLNDSHGHEVGDLLLIEVAQRLKSCVRAVDTVARFGGDEFVVIVSEMGLDAAVARNEVGSVASKILARLSEPYELAVQRDGRTESSVAHRCSASIGVALFKGNGTKADDVLKWADAAMYLAKDAGRAAIRLHDGSPVC